MEKKSGLNRNLQNLTAKYNILFNANVLLREKQDAYAAAYVDDYSELLAVYRDTITQSAEPDPDLELVKTKANNIISLKEQSHYVGNGYLLLAKANYLQANYFDAVEYSSYVIRSFPENKELQTEATVWKARALLYLKKNDEAKHVLDTALLNIDPKKKPDANIYATRLQYDINTQNYAEGEEMAKQAIEYSRNSMERLRWTFILGQLQELNNKPGDAIASYARVANSNVAFNMAFNAQLNRIRIEDQQNGVKISRIDRLRSLLKNSNNKEFIDQIYFQIAEMQMIDKDIDKAINNYNLSVRYSATNQAQKSLSYLRLADIYFKNKADYAKAKNYYDSTLLTMSPNYIGYASIKKKADNLQLLADRLQTIAREDTLQMLARMDEAARNKKIDEMVNRNTLQQQAAAVSVANANVDPFVNDVASPQQSTPNGSSFYFYNSNAVSTGFTDFKRVWGNRRLEDNWRRGSRSGGDIAANTPPPTTPQNTDPDALPDPLKRSPDQVDATQFRQDILQNLPLNAALLAQSNDRIYSAYLDIANFYRDVLEDRKEAIAVYETLTKRFPNNPNAAAVYYNLYRLYSEQDAARSDQYKAILLRDYKETPFAKTILDPDYSRRLSNEDNGFSILYNKIYDLYVSRQHSQVITQAATLLQQYPNNRYAAQLQYLKAFAAGHQEKLAPFQADLQFIASTYPDDKLITPLVNQHLAYINVNQAELAARPIVLTEKDANEPGFTIPIVYQQKTEYRYPSLGETEIVPDVRKPEAKPVENLQAAQNVNQKPAISSKTDLPKNINAPSIIPKTEPLAPAVTETPTPVAAPPKKPTYAFNELDSTNYYFVVNVSSGTTNVASSRFGIGQFNRVNFERDAIKHQLRTAGQDNQLIFVGRFYNLNNVKDYARAIVPLLPDIMKVPKDKYSFFIITQENLNKLADKKTLDSYIEYYQQNF
uniref:type IX secretion system periplasmic lipoprotein PorW/SprE n=1 Tax=Mucilaginibacter pallidiroseus TaxID=2599295 RepID=UPI001646C91F|nr:tetratricopeptide repeat protein [Mucilaginibacter pallidiroseus]